MLTPSCGFPVDVNRRERRPAHCVSSVAFVRSRAFAGANLSPPRSPARTSPRFIVLAWSCPVVFGFLVSVHFSSLEPVDSRYIF